MTAAWPWNVCATAVASVTSSLTGCSRPPQSPLKKRWELGEPDIGQGHHGDRRVLQQIVRAGTALEPGAEDQHFHYYPGKGRSSENSP